MNAEQPPTPAVRQRMQRQARRDTAPEMELRRRLHALGLRYRVDRAVVPGTRRRADVVFGVSRVAVFVDGCFWHSCPQHGTTPSANRQWWVEKLQANVRRDRDTDAALTAAGWSTIRVWEHQDMESAASSIHDEVIRRRIRPAGSGTSGRSRTSLDSHA